MKIIVNFIIERQAAKFCPPRGNDRFCPGGVRAWVSWQPSGW